MEPYQPQALADRISYFVIDFNNRFRVTMSGWEFNIEDLNPPVELNIELNPIVLCLNIGSNPDNKNAVIELLSGRGILLTTGEISTANQCFIARYKVQASASVLEE